jgi:hypothetical protein
MTNMSHFVKLTTLTEDGNYLREWVEQATIKVLSQNSASQGGNNAGTCEFVDGTIIELIAFNETLESLA